MRLVIHPGLPKAGSTSIQMYLGDHAAELRALGIGFVAPVSASSSDALAERFLDGVDALVHGDQGPDLSVIVVSHESFIGADVKVVRAFLDQVGIRGIDAEVLIVTRPLAEWLVSRDTQRLRA